MHSGETKLPTTPSVFVTLHLIVKNWMGQCELEAFFFLLEESNLSSVRFFGLSRKVKAFKTNCSDSENVTNDDF